METCITSRQCKPSTMQKHVQEDLAAYGRAITSLTMTRRASTYLLAQGTRRRTNCGWREDYRDCGHTIPTINSVRQFKHTHFAVFVPEDCAAIVAPRGAVLCQKNRASPCRESWSKSSNLHIQASRKKHKLLSKGQIICTKRFELKIP